MFILTDKVPTKPLSCWAQIIPFFENTADPDQLASEEAILSEFSLYLLTAWKLRVNRIQIGGGGGAGGRFWT